MLTQVHTYVRERLDPALLRERAEAAVRLLTRYWLPRVPRPATLPAPAPGPAPQPIVDHWELATSAVASAVSSLERIEGLQAAAARKIDAAEYALQHLLEELRAVMPLPADGAPLRAILAEAVEPSAARAALAA